MKDKEKVTIVLASTNKNKLREVREILSGLDMSVIPLDETGFNEEIEENGETFEENAYIKAKAVCDKLKVAALADDSGLVIDAMPDELGVHSARFMGHDTSYDEKNRCILERLKDVPDEKRSARFVCAMCAVFPDGRRIDVKETMEGVVAKQISGSNGFGYDPIFFLPDRGMTSADIPPEEKNSISHRGKALRKMAKELMIEDFGNPKRVLVISDTHGRLGDVQALLDRINRPDLLIHLGDIESDPERLAELAGCRTVCISGNCDFNPALEREMVIRIGRYKVWLTHGNRYGVKGGLGILKDQARERGADIVMFGHTHTPVITYDEELTIINPGSLTYPSQVPSVPTFIMMDIDDNGVAHFTINRFV